MEGGEFDKCILCGSPQLDRLQRYAEAHLVKCKNCGFVFAKKRPTQQELIEHYEGYGRNDYLSPITIKRYHEILDRFELYRSTKRILDVGCGIGYFLEIALKHNWMAFGTEFTDEAINICESKGITMHRGKLDPSNYDEKFDVITSIEVIEHINDPLEDLQKMYALLRPGGLLYITTPNFNSISRRYLKEKSTIVQYPEHLTYYTARTIRKALNDTGFNVKKMQATGISLTRLKKSKGLSEEDYISESSSDEKMRKRMEVNPVMKFAKKSTNLLLSASKLGDTLKVWAIKPKE